MAEIRLAEGRDAEAIAVIQVKSWQAAYRGIMPNELLYGDECVDGRKEGWRRRVTAEQRSHFVIEKENRIISFLIMDKEQDKRVSSQDTEITAVYLDPSEWGKGYGRELMLFAFEEAKRRGYHTVSLWALRENERAIGFYQHMGFQWTGEEKGLRVGEKATIMEQKYCCIL